MANSTYIGSDGTIVRFPDDRNPQDLGSLTFLEPDTDWNMFQQPASSQEHQKHDSLAYSPSDSRDLSSSLHQAESQPCPNATLNISTPSDKPQFPVNNYATRSASHRPSLPGNQPPRHYIIHRASCDSFDGTLSSNQSNMVRSYPGTSESLDATPQPHQRQSPFSQTNWHAGRPSNFSPDFAQNRRATVTTGMYQFNLAEYMGSGVGGSIENGEQYLDTDTHTNK